MFDHMHWAQWVLFGVMLGAFSWFAIACIREPGRQRRRIAAAEKQREFYDHVVDLIKRPHFDFGYVADRWDGLTAEYQKKVLEQIPTLLASENIDTYELYRKLESLRDSPLSELIPRDTRTALARTCIERTTDGLSAYALAKEAWGSGNIPTDILLKLLQWVDEQEIVEDEVRPENAREIATYLAKKGDYLLLNDMHEEGCPKEYLLLCLESLLQEEVQKRDHDQVLYCYADLEDWKGLAGYVEDPANANLLSGEDYLSVMEGAPKEVHEKFLAWAADRGWLLGLVRFYNPDFKEDEEDIQDAGVKPPQELLRRCLAYLLEKMKDNDEHEQFPTGVAADCAIMLRDTDACKKVADICIRREFPDTAGRLLYFIERTRYEGSVTQPIS